MKDTTDKNLHGKSYYEKLAREDYIEGANRFVPGYAKILLPDIIQRTVDYNNEHFEKPIIADIGCGPGHVSAAVAQDLNNRATFYCIDTNDEMLSQARGYFEESKHNLEIFNYNIVANPEISIISDNTITTVISNMFAHNILDDDIKRAWVKAVFNKLAPGGLFIWGDYVSFEDKDYFDEQIKIRKKHALEKGADPAFVEENFKKELTLDNPWTPEQMIELMNIVGFKNIEKTQQETTFANIVGYKI